MAATTRIVTITRPRAQACDWRNVPAQLADGRLRGGDEQERRQEDEQHQIRVELDVGDAGHESKGEAAQDEQGGVGDVDPASDRVQNGNRDKNSQNGDQRLHSCRSD